MLSLSKRTVAYITNYGNIFLQRSVVEFKPYAWVWEVKSGNANRQRVSLQKRVLMNCIYMVTFKWKRLSIIQEAGNEAVVSHPRLEAEGRYQLQKLEKKMYFKNFGPWGKFRLIWQTWWTPQTHAIRKMFMWSIYQFDFNKYKPTRYQFTRKE